MAGAAFGDSVLQFSWQAQHLVILSLQFSWQAQHLVTLDWKELSRACGEILNRNVEINVILWFSAQSQAKTQIVTLRSQEKTWFYSFFNVS